MVIDFEEVILADSTRAHPTQRFLQVRAAVRRGPAAGARALKPHKLLDLAGIVDGSARSVCITVRGAVDAAVANTVSPKKTD